MALKDVSVATLRNISFVAALAGVVLVVLAFTLSSPVNWRVVAVLVPAAYAIAGSVLLVVVARQPADRRSTAVLWLGRWVFGASLCFVVLAVATDFRTQNTLTALSVITFVVAAFSGLPVKLAQMKIEHDASKARERSAR